MAHISSPLRDQSVINSLITKEANIFRGNPGCPNRRQDHKRWGNNPLWSHKQPNIPGRRSEGRWQNHQSPCDSVGFNGCGDSKVQKAIGRLWTNRICGQWHLRGFKLYMRIYHIHIHIWPITDLPARTSPNSPCPILHLSLMHLRRFNRCDRLGSLTSTGILSIRKKPIERSCENGGTAPVEVGRLSHDLQGFIYTSQVVGLGISEPINSITWSLKSRGFWAQHKVTTLSCHGLPHPFTSRWMGSRHGCLGFCF